MKINLPTPEKIESTWIPCSERQPEKDGRYLVTCEKYFVPDHVDQINHTRDISIEYYSAKYKHWFTDEVFAWMELPPMYVNYTDPDVVNCLNCKFYDPDYHILYEVTGNKEYKDLGYCKQSEKDKTLNQSAGPGLYCKHFKFKKV